MRYSIIGRLLSFRHAFRGVVWLVRREPNAWVHFVATAVVISLGCVLRVSRTEWCWLVAAMVAVWTAEAFNTAIEQLCNAVESGPNQHIGRCKDLAAGAVLISATGAAGIGCLILGPPLWALLQ